MPGGLPAFWVDFSGDVEIASTTPLPAALPLFASGAAVFGFFGWRKRRKQPASA